MKALITGASSGIGAALIPLLEAKGYALILSGRNEAKLRGKWPYIVADLAKKEGRECVVEAIRREQPDLLVNCAGYGMYGEMLSIPISEQLAILDVNATAPIELTLEAAQECLRVGKRGVILNVSSTAGEFPAPGMGLYGPAKACLTHFSRTLNTELAPKGVHVLVCSPGMVATAFAERAAKKRVKPRGPVMSVEFAAREMVKQIERLQERRVINWIYRLATWLVPAGVAKRMIWKRIKERI